MDVDWLIDGGDGIVHSRWSKELAPILEAESGDVITINCPDSAGGAITESSTAADTSKLADEQLQLVGPVAIKGVRPGEVLQIDFLEISHRGRGFTAYPPGEANTGLLPEDFPDGDIYHWKLHRDVGYFVDGIEVPLDPFPGAVGVAPAAAGDHPTIPPRGVGGNLDIKHLTEGSTLYLPVEVDGAKFSIGDGHAAQGDGEVCGTGIEAPLSVTVRVDRRPDISITRPHFTTPGPFGPRTDERMYATAGVSTDLVGASKQAIRQMIEHLESVAGLTASEAYMLSSVIVDLKINELVNEPNWVVSAYLPKSIFP